MFLRRVLDGTRQFVPWGGWKGNYVVVPNKTRTREHYGAAANIKQVRCYSKKPMVDYFIFGSCEAGQLGFGREKQVVLTPRRLEILRGLDVYKLVIGHNHSVVILENGAALSWGFNETGQLGQGHRNPCSAPRPIIGLDGHNVEDAVCGPYQTFLVTQNLRTGKQAVWHTGAGHWDPRPEEQFTTFTTEPRKIKKRQFLGLKKIIKIAVASEFGALITDDNLLHTWGRSGNHASLGHGERKEISQTDGLSINLPGPTPVPSLEDKTIVDVVLGWGHGLALTDDHKVYAWGCNIHGQCGVDSGAPSIVTPRLISFFEENKIPIVQIATGQTHSIARSKNNELYIWGSYAEGKLGLAGVNQDVLLPMKMDVFEGKDVTHVTCGTDHSAAIVDSKDIYVWGFGQHGALSAVSEFKNVWLPLAIPSFSTNEKNLPKNILNSPFFDEELRKAIFKKEDRGSKEEQKEKKHDESLFDHVPVGVQCGMDITVAALKVIPNEELIKTTETKMKQLFKLFKEEE